VIACVFDCVIDYMIACGFDCVMVHVSQAI